MSKSWHAGQRHSRLEDDWSQYLSVGRYPDAFLTYPLLEENLGILLWSDLALRHLPHTCLLLIARQARLCSRIVVPLSWGTCGRWGFLETKERLFIYRATIQGQEYWAKNLNVCFVLCERLSCYEAEQTVVLFFSPASALAESHSGVRTP